MKNIFKFELNKQTLRKKPNVIHNLKPKFEENKENKEENLDFDEKNLDFDEIIGD